MIIERIVELLSQQGKMQKDLCKYLDVGTSTFSNWVTRGTDPPSKYIIPICEFLGVSCEYLLTGKEKKIQMSQQEQDWMNLFYGIPSTERRECIGFVKGYIARSYQESVQEPNRNIVGK